MNKSNKPPKDNRGALLWWAVKEQYAAVVESLLQSGASPDTKYEEGQRPLLWIAAKGDEVIADLLLAHDADTEFIGSWCRNGYGIPGYDYAIGGKHLDIARRLVDEALTKLTGAETELMDKYNRTLLLWAAKIGYETAFTQLLLREDYRNAADIRDFDKRTALSCASEGGYEPIVRILLGDGANANSKDKDKCTPLWFAATNGHEACVRLLLDSKADLHCGDEKNHDTPLHKAAMNGDINIASLLLDHGAEVDILNLSKIPPLSHAAENGDVEMVNLLLSRSAQTECEKSYQGRKTLGRAAANGHLAVVVVLLAHGAVVNPIPASRSDGEPPLSEAAGGGHVDIVNLLLAPPHSANPNWYPPRYSSSRPPLVAAAESGNERIVRRLLVCGAEVNSSENRYNGTALSIAADNGYESVVKVLLEKGAEVEEPGLSRGSYQDTKRAIVLAAKGGHTGVVSLLLEKGVGKRRSSAKKKSKAGDKEEKPWQWLITPLKEAAESGHEEVVRLLLERMSELDVNGKSGGEISKGKIGAELGWEHWWQLWISDENNKEDTVRTLLKFGADPNRGDQGDGTPLCSVEDVAIARILLEGGALPDQGRDRDGWTALAKAVAKAVNSRALEMVKLLLEYNVDTEIKDKDECAPLLLAAQGGALDIVKLLVEGGADLETEDKQGRTPLSWAGWNHHGAVVKYLLDAKADPSTYLGQNPSQDPYR
ncbi:Ankyrin-1 [Dactylellina cionopaga]|nr:Ankyrin-1 [Dactylellina cionopaga]